MLQPLALIPLHLGSIKPSGWLRNQLRLQASGLSGHLDEFWPDVMNSGWIGGDAEGWERGPYWLDGVVPLAFLLEDERLIAKVRRWMDHILSNQHADGWLGPVKGADRYESHDPWPVFVALKAMRQYFEATADSRIPSAMLRFLLRFDQLIDQRPLFHWGRFRWADLLVTLFWLHELIHDPRLLDMAQQVIAQGYDWSGFAADIPWKTKVTREMLEQFKLQANGDWGNDRYMSSHGVNVAMGLKAPAVKWRLSGDDRDRTAAANMLRQLDQHHGQANGIFSCDEHLAGLHPSQGTELCAVVEMMYSLETLLSITGEPLFAERLEKLAFNALPATFSPDMWAHQYIQQANQVICRVSSDRIYTNNGPEANLFGIEPNYGCCTANLSQGWPKFAAHLWMKSHDGGLAAISYAPCEVTADIGGASVRVDVDTAYPFEEQVRLRVTASKPVEFALRLLVPRWSDAPSLWIQGQTATALQPGTFHEVRRTWSGTTRLRLDLPMLPRIVPRPKNRVAIERGPLVYALAIGEDWRLLRGQPPLADWEIYPATPWNYALQLDRISFSTRAVGDCPFSPDGAAVRAHARGRRIDEWLLEQNAAAEPPAGPIATQNPLEPLTLIPYGCTSLRVAEFPSLDQT